MNIVTSLEEWLIIRKKISGKSKGFVHTMGNLHAGHISLCKRSIAMNDLTIAAIFINRKQFNNQSDFDLYPRTIDHDISLLSQHGVDYLLLFDEKTLYADNYQIQISETGISNELEGKFRPGHFTGMLTIVLKFLNIVRPDFAYYGEKDYQQLLLIKKMVKALFMPVEIIGCPTIRAADNLALSSRNSRLDTTQRKMAAEFPALLQKNAALHEITRNLEEAGFRVDYVEEKWQRRLAAVWIDDIRLIDNFALVV